MEPSIHCSTKYINKLCSEINLIAPARQLQGEAHDPVTAWRNIGKPWSLAVHKNNPYMSGSFVWWWNFMDLMAIPFYHTFAFGIASKYMLLIWNKAVAVFKNLQVCLCDVCGVNLRKVRPMKRRVLTWARGT